MAQGLFHKQNQEIKFLNEHLLTKRMTEQSPRVLIGAPTAAPYQYCLKEYAAGIKNLAYKNYDVLLADNSEQPGYETIIEQEGLKAIRAPTFIKDSRERLAASRNLLRDYVLKERYDYFLSLEQDVIPPADILERFLAHKKPVMTGVYFKPFTLSYTHKGQLLKKVKKLMPLLCGIIPGVQNKMHPFSAEEVTEPRVMQVRFSGLGCIFIHRDVLEKIEFRADTNVPCHDDVWFSQDLWSNKIPLFCDTSVKCKHLLNKKPQNLFNDVKKGFNPGFAIQEK
jgi:hypothetical protein